MKLKTIGTTSWMIPVRLMRIFSEMLIRSAVQMRRSTSMIRSVHLYISAVAHMMLPMLTLIAFPGKSQ